ncbi:MAG: DUF4838 domain-containing protein, partial [Candidatus Omnitrophica bacterium]|nr:DUF4838 domain-containing protein [Candidatus Omnitrophota bacterium]
MAGKIVIAISFFLSGLLFSFEKPLVLEDCQTNRWQGKVLPVVSRYQPLQGEVRSALKAYLPADIFLPIEANLEGAGSFNLRLVSEIPVDITVRLKSGEGSFSARWVSIPGEEVVLLPLGVFERSGNAVGWEKIEGIQLQAVAEKKAKEASIVLLGIEVLPPGMTVRGEQLFLVRPVNRLNSIGRAWPLYAILSETAYPEKAEQSPVVLQKLLREMFNLSLPINPPGLSVNLNPKNVFLLGPEVALKSGTINRKELEQQGYFGLVVKAEQGGVTIAGLNRHGTAYGIYAFLEKQGCRFYGSGCQKIPRKAEKVVFTCQFADKPFFPGPRIGPGYEIYGAPSDAWGLANKAENQEFFTDISWGWREHTAGYLVPRQIYYDKHPEYFRLQGDGTRLPKDTSNFRTVICTTHPDVLKISAQRALRWIALQPDRKFFSITQGDDHEWCRCDRCRSMEYQPGNYSDMMLYWVNYVAREVAKKYPDKSIITYAYGPTQPPPVKLKPEPNVYIFYCAWPNASSAPCGIRDFDAPENYLAKQEIEGWLKVAPGRVGLYDYNAYGCYTLNGMAWKVKWCAQRNMCGFMYCGINQSFRPLFQYVHSKLNWNPFLEVANLKRDFIYAYYRQAAPIMEKIINTIYDRIEYGNYDSRMHGVPPADYWTKPFVTETLALFDQAIALLPEGAWGKKSEVMKDREWFINNCLSVTKPAGRKYTEEELEVFGLCLKEYLSKWLEEHNQQVEIARVEKKKAPGYDDIANKLWNWARIKVETEVSEGEIPSVLTRLMKDPIATIKKEMVTNFVEKIPDG